MTIEMDRNVLEREYIVIRGDPMYRRELYACTKFVQQLIGRMHFYVR
jgi:hypothetical protein